MSTVISDIRDAGPLSVEDEVIAFEAEMEEALSPEACLVGGGYYSIYPTYVTICGSYQ